MHFRAVQGYGHTLLFTHKDVKLCWKRSRASAGAYQVRAGRPADEDEGRNEQGSNIVCRGQYTVPRVVHSLCKVRASLRIRDRFRAE